jgi:hypothetical protein
MTTKRKEQKKKTKTATHNTSAVCPHLIRLYRRGFYGPDGDYDKSESSDLIFNQSTDEDMDMKPAPIDISGMVVDEVRNIGATVTIPDSPPATDLLSYSTRYASYLQNRKTNPLLNLSPIPPPPPPLTLSVRIVKLNLMPIIPGLPESGLIKDCMWPADSEDGRHIVHVLQDLNISIHKRSERQLRHVVFHCRRMYRSAVEYLNDDDRSGYWTCWETCEELEDKIVDPTRIQGICLRMDIIGRPLTSKEMRETI